jgi:hypothetical protein
MMKKQLILVNLSILFLVNLVLTPFNSVYSQDGNLDGLVNDTKNDLMMVVGGGLAGAVLGLSTLSFVEEPKDHTKNIIVGASIGIIVGVGVVAMSQANKSRDMIYGSDGGMDDQAYKSGKSFGTLARSSWHHNTTGKHTQLIHSPYGVGYSFTY